MTPEDKNSLELSRLRPRVRATGIGQSPECKKSISLRLDPNLVKRLRSVANKRKVTINSIVELSLEQGLKQLEVAK